MLLAAYRDTPYKIMLFAHILLIMIALSPAVVHTILFKLEAKRPDGDPAAIARRVIGLPTKIYDGALIVGAVLGFGLISMSDDVISMGDTWVWLSIVLWIALMGLLHGLIYPTEAAIARGDEGAMAQMDKVGPLGVIIAIVLLFLMVVKPGGGLL